MVLFRWIKLKRRRVTTTNTHFHFNLQGQIWNLTVNTITRDNYLIDIYDNQISKTVCLCSPLQKTQQVAECEWLASFLWGHSGKTLCRCDTTWGSILVFLLDGKNIQASPARQQLRRRALQRWRAGRLGFLQQRMNWGVWSKYEGWMLTLWREWAEIQ